MKQRGEDNNMMEELITKVTTMLLHTPLMPTGAHSTIQLEKPSDAKYLDILLASIICNHFLFYVFIISLFSFSFIQQIITS
jgi:hypothetical protein